MRLSGMQGPGLWSPGVTGESGRWLEEPGLWLQVARSKARAELRAHGPRRQAPWRTPRRPRRSCATAGLASAVVAIGSGRAPVACRDQDRVSRAWREVSDHTHGGSRLLLAGQPWPRGWGDSHLVMSLCWLLLPHSQRDLQGSWGEQPAGCPQYDWRGTQSLIL